VTVGQVAEFKGGDRFEIFYPPGSPVSAEMQVKWQYRTGTVLPRRDHPAGGRAWVEVLLDESRPDGFGVTPFRWPTEEMRHITPLNVEPFVSADPAPFDRPVSATGGAKEVKAQRFDQIPTYPLMKLAERFGFGNGKYPTDPGDVDNWRKGYPWSASYAALQRHAVAFWNGEDNDPETGQPHLSAVAWHAFALLEWSRHPEIVELFDDRQDAGRAAVR
jgi:hypothetical protein